MPALTEELKRQRSDQIFTYKATTLLRTTAVTPWDDGNTYSASAYFTVNGENVAIRCVSKTRAAVVAFHEHIRQLFTSDSSTTYLSLDMIVAGARTDIAKRPDLSDADITLTYIDQFSETHVL
jgi:hypothetical protein